jgi:hypothetical protein
LINWDESDGPFEIVGEIEPNPPCSVCPDLSLGEVIEVLERIMNELQKAIVLLKEVSQ